VANGDLRRRRVSARAKADAEAELHADFDRKGGLNESASERDVRTQAPGAVLVANVDVNARTLPATVSEGSAPTKDFNQGTASASDPDLLQLRIKKKPPTAVPGAEFILRFVAPRNPAPGVPVTVMPTRISGNDASGAILRNPPGVGTERILPPFPADGVLNVTLEARTIAGSPFSQSSDVTRLTFQKDNFDETNFQLELISRPPGSQDPDLETLHDTASFSVAPIILVDRSAPPQRLYLCDVPENEPTRRDIQQAMQAVPSVKLVLVPTSVANGDTWLQDQYQHAVTRAPRGGWRQILLHTPRQVGNMVFDVATSNLAQFVDSHFPSKGIGVFSDWRERSILVIGSDGSQNRVQFGPSFKLLMDMDNVRKAHVELNQMGEHVAGKDWVAIAADEWSAMRDDIPVLKDRLVQEVDARLIRTSGVAADQLVARRDRANKLAETIEELFPFGASEVQVTIDGRQVEVAGTFLNQLYNRLFVMHGSGNYGGNIESTPPFDGAPLGKIIIGNVRDPAGDHVDPEVLRVFAKQRKQQIVEIDPTWLRVGHIDEFMAVVPSTRGGQKFAFLQASPQAALAIVRAAHDRYVRGLPTTLPNGAPHNHRGEPNRNSIIFDQRETSDGTSPVTRLLRGKGWLHEHPTGGNLKADSPKLHQNLAKLLEEFRGSQGSAGKPDKEIVYVPGAGADRRYRADISVREILFCEQDANGASTQEFIQTKFIAPAFSKLAAAVPNTAVLPLPVIFDRSRDTAKWGENPRQDQTIAFTPDLVNLQVLGTHLLIPRPYGPRMLPADAIAVVTGVMSSLELPTSTIERVSNALIARKRMGTAIYWVEPLAPAFLQVGSRTTQFPGIQSENEVMEQFSDSFPGASPTTLEQNIITPNAAAFTGAPGSRTLKDGFHRFTINDGMVDLFELFTLAVVEDAGLTAHFVDSWFYHIHDGGIHCGTNVLAQPVEGQLPNPWETPDVPELT